MNSLIVLFALVATVIILTRCVCIASTTSRHDWEGHPLQFVGISIGYPLLAGGALGMLLGWHIAPWLLLFGTAIATVSDRRSIHHWTRR